MKLLIYDKLTNGKGLHFDIADEKVQYKNCANLQYKYTHIIFSYNECRLDQVDYNLLQQISKLVKSKCTAKIINDPIYNSFFRSKIYFYNAIQQNNLDINIAETKEITNINDIEFPVIIAQPVAYGGKNRQLYYSKDQLCGINLKNFICIKYLESKLYGKYFSGRILAFNNTIIYYFPRFGNTWIVNGSIMVDTQTINKGYIFMKKSLPQLQHIVMELCKLFNDCFYHIDLILHNNMWYVCEVGLKFTPDMYLKKLVNHDIYNEFKISMNTYGKKIIDLL